MLLVTLTCNSQLYPPDDVRGQPPFPSSHQSMIIRLADSLPGLIIAQADGLHLDPDMTEEAVQVDIRKFHAYGVNTPDLWVEVRLTEAHLGIQQRCQVRETFVSMLADWFLKHSIAPSWALDAFFGPGHGAIALRGGEIIQRW